MLCKAMNLLQTEPKVLPKISKAILVAGKVSVEFESISADSSLDDGPAASQESHVTVDDKFPSIVVWLDSIEARLVESIII